MTAEKLLTSVKNFDGYELRYTYDTRSPYRVKKIAEYAGETAGKSLSLTYGYNSTKFTDNKNRSEIYRFNNSGTSARISMTATAMRSVQGLSAAATM